MPRGAKKPRRRSSSRKKINNNDKKKKTSTATMQNIEEEKERVWHLVRPLFVLFGAGLVMNFSMYVEEHPTGGVPDGDPNTILDTGFVATRNAHQYLSNHRFINDIAAFGNSILVVFALVYVGYIALWIGDFGLTFRLLSCQFLRFLNLSLLLYSFFLLFSRLLKSINSITLFSTLSSILFIIL